MLQRFLYHGELPITFFLWDKWWGRMEGHFRYLICQAVVCGLSRDPCDNTLRGALFGASNTLGPPLLLGPRQIHFTSLFFFLKSK